MQEGVEATDEQQSRLMRIKDRVFASKYPPEEWRKTAFALAEIALEESLKDGIQPPAEGFGYVLFVDEDGYAFTSYPVATLAMWRGCTEEDYKAEMRGKFVGVPVRVILAVGAYGKSWTIELIKTEKSLLN